MFFLLAIGSALFYSLQNAILVKYARELKGFELVAYRNFSMIFSGLPLLLFVPTTAYSDLGDYFWWIALAAFSGSAALGMLFLAYRSIPAGIASAFTRARVLIIAVLSFIFLGETLSTLEITAIVAILVGVIYMSLQKKQFNHLSNKTNHGYIYLTLNTTLVAISFFIFSWVSRQMNPLLAGYIWEILIGISALFFLLIEVKWTKHKLHKFQPKLFLKIGAIASLAVIGTACYALAVNYGKLAIAQTIAVTSTIFIALYSHFIYHEKLSKKQWLAICFILGNVVLLKIFG